MAGFVAMLASVTGRAALVCYHGTGSAAFHSNFQSAPDIPTAQVEVQMDDPEQGGSRRGAVAGLAIAVALLAVGIWLAHQLTAASKMQDCLMSGRTNCNAVDPAAR
jgi:hypothetical protein